MPVTSIDDAAWASSWRQRRVGEKVALCGALLLTALTAPVWPTAPLIVIASFVLAVAWARIPPRVYAIVVGVPLAFIIIGVLTIGITLGGPVAADQIARFGPFGITRASLAAAGVVLGRSLAGTSAMLLLAMTTPMVDLLTWGRRLRIPDVLLEVASLIYRLIFVLLESVFRVREAQLNRLVDAGPRAQQWQGVARGMGSVLTRTWQRAARLEDGLAARGYENSLRTLPAPRPRDPAFLAVGAALVAALWASAWLMKVIA